MVSPTSEYDGLAVYATPGAQPAVLWVHGYTLDSTVWTELWGALPGWRHVGVDLAGHGRSRPLRRHETLRDIGLTLGALAGEYGAEHLVGMSFGGMVAMQSVIECPRRFVSLTLGSPALGGGPTDADAATRNLQLIQLFRTRGVGLWLRDLWMQWPPDIFKSAANHPPLWNALAEIVARHPWTELRDVSMERLARHSQVAQLAGIGCRTLILVGEDDMLAFKRCAELIQRVVPASRRVYLPATGHLSLLERVPDVVPLLDRHWQAA